MIKLLKKICILSKNVGYLIMKYYSHKELINIFYKSDKTPVTNVDLEVNNIIYKKLMLITPNVPIISEEELCNINIYQNYSNYWLIDPLDGTREFLNGNRYFTVNISLIKNHIPIMGVIYAPFFQVLYYSLYKKAWKEENNVNKEIKVCNIKPPLVVVSRSHYDKKIDHYLEQIGEHRVKKIGSSLKFCLIAEGKAQIYPRFGNTHIWDTAAGQSILTASGGTMETWKGEKLIYQPSSNIINPGFCAYAS